MSNKNIIVTSVTLNGIFAMIVAILLLKAPEVQEIKVGDQVLIARIEKLEKENSELLINVKELNDTLVSISKSKQTVKYIYREKIKFIKSANSVQLDSIIRANW
jgi:uncharacterized protein (UPF0335 family)